MEVRFGYHLLSTYCMPGKLQTSSPFHQLTNRNFRIVCIFIKETLELREVEKNYVTFKLVSSRRGIQIQIHPAAKPVTFPSFPTHNFLYAHGVLVLFMNQEHPHSEDYIGFSYFEIANMSVYL